MLSCSNGHITVKAACTAVQAQIRLNANMEREAEHRLLPPAVLVAGEQIVSFLCTGPESVSCAPVQDHTPENIWGSTNFLKEKTQNWVDDERGMYLRRVGGHYDQNTLY